jgi:hypothetical protein
MAKQTLMNVPPSEQVKAELLAAHKEVRALRSLYRLARETEDARDARSRTISCSQGATKK